MKSVKSLRLSRLKAKVIPPHRHNQEQKRDTKKETYYNNFFWVKNSSKWLFYKLKFFEVYKMVSSDHRFIISADDMRKASDRDELLLKDYSRIVGRVCLHMNESTTYHATFVTIQLNANDYEIMYISDSRERVMPWRYDTTNCINEVEVGKITNLLRSDFTQKGYIVSDITDDSCIAALKISWAAEEDQLNYVMPKRSWFRRFIWWYR